MSNQAEKSAPSALEARLIELIRGRGPISVADYIEDALLHPHDGYYTSKTPFGPKGDFTTAPEVSQIFGELIGLWLVQSWTDLGTPANFNLIEMGPGRGVLMADILRVVAIRPEFEKACTVWLVETSGRLRHEQQKTLRDVSSPLHWRDSLSDVPEGPSLIVANELFDCLPIRQYQMTNNGWRERMVGLSQDGNALSFTLDSVPPEPDVPLPNHISVQEGDIFEFSEARESLAEEIARRAIDFPSRALIIDYGHQKSGIGETLQSVRDHRPWPTLSTPGEADLTSHVDFERLSRAVFIAGAGAFGPIPQGTFLDKLGLAMRVEKLCANTSSADAEVIRAGAFRIAATSQMGEIFKAFCIGSPHLPTPPGFEHD